MNIKEIEDQINQIIASEEGVFLVSLDFKPINDQKGKLLIVLDGDNGVSIDQCAFVSRKLSALLEEDENIVEPFTLEVTSFGVGEPLVLNRQYIKNVDRNVSVLHIDGSKTEGKLVAADSDKLTLLKMKVHKHKKSYAKEPTEIAFSDISKTKVLVSF